MLHTIYSIISITQSTKGKGCIQNLANVPDILGVCNPPLIVTD